MFEQTPAPHANILSIDEVFRISGRVWLLTSAWGEDLASRLAPPAQVSLYDRLAIVRDVVEALAAAHDRGLVHGALGARRVRFDDEDTVRLDFLHAGSGLDVQDSLAPEHLHGEVTDQRTDVHAAGCLVYWLLTGRHPFAAADFAGIAHRTLSEPPTSPRELEPRIPPALATWVLRALDRDPRARYPHGGAMRDALYGSWGAVREAGVVRPAAAEVKARGPW